MYAFVHFWVIQFIGRALPNSTPQLSIFPKSPVPQRRVRVNMTFWMTFAILIKKIFSLDFTYRHTFGMLSTDLMTKNVAGKICFIASLFQTLKHPFDVKKLRENGKIGGIYANRCGTFLSYGGTLGLRNRRKAQCLWYRCLVWAGDICVEFQNSWWMKG